MTEREINREELAERVVEFDDVSWDAITLTDVDDGGRVGLTESFRILSDIARFGREESPEGSVFSREAPTGGTPKWGQLDVLDALGEGTLGEAYRAQRDAGGPGVVVRFFHPRRTRPEWNFPDVLLEGEKLKALSHPHLARVYGAGSHGGRVGMVVERLDGPTLSRILGEGSHLDEEEVRILGTELAEAVQTLHRAGLIHRELRPTNVYRVDHGWVFLDAGGAHLPMRFDADDALTELDARLFFAPELLSGAAPSVRSDVYALAACLYFARTGRPPHRAATVGELRSRHADPAALAQLQKDVPFYPALQPVPDHRPTSAAQLAELLRDADR